MISLTSSSRFILQLWESWLSKAMQYKGKALCSTVTEVTYRWICDSKARAGMHIRNICKNMSALGQMHCWEMRQFCLKTIVLPEHESKEKVHCVALEMQLFHEKRWALIIVKVAETQSEKTLRSYCKQDLHFEFRHLPFLIQHCCCSNLFFTPP